MQLTCLGILVPVLVISSECFAGLVVWHLVQTLNEPIKTVSHHGALLK
jgi:hypothetical protein